MAIFLGMITPAAASLKFENTSAEITVKPGVDNAQVVFSFQNTGDEKIEIADYQTGCGCLKAKLKDDKTIYEPGEKGEVIGDFDLRNLFGQVDKSIVLHLKDDEKGKPSFVLTTKITIPELLKVEPRTLNWTAGEEATPKSYKITVNQEEPLKITDVVTTNNIFIHELKTIKEGKEYEIIVTPTNVSETHFGIIKITSDSDLQRFRRISAFANIK